MKRELKDIWDAKRIEHRDEILNILLKWYKNPKTKDYWKRICEISDWIKNLK